MFGLRTFMQKNIIKKKINNTRQHHILNTICKQISTKSKEFVDNLNFSFLASGTTRGSLYGLYTRLTRTGKRAPNSEAPRSWWKTGWEVAWWERLRDEKAAMLEGLLVRHCQMLILPPPLPPTSPLQNKDFLLGDDCVYFSRSLAYNKIWKVENTL